MFQAFTDIQLKARIKHLLASLSYHEAQYGQTINLCHAAQAVKEEQEDFWYDSIVLLAEATIKEKYNIETVRKVGAYLVHEHDKFTRRNENIIILFTNHSNELRNTFFSQYSGHTCKLRAAILILSL